MNSNHNNFKIALTLVTSLFITGLSAQKGPFFEKGNDPKPATQNWSLVKEMSDEFDGKKMDESKWQISGQGWIGRAPGLFLAENVSISDGSLKIISKMLPEKVVKQGKEFTHSGGYVGSRVGNTYGYYECEVKANKTFMSTTFWLINEGKNVEGCDKRTTELDILETVGQITSPKEWMKNFDQQMNSNTHSRNIPDGCDYKKASNGAKAAVNGKVYDDFHVYGVWWKSADEVQFFLDGKHTSTVKPPANFDIAMYLRLVVETYDWNPVPEDGGLNGSLKDRTTTYNWVRSWKLVN
ncbi:family 16 glycosylhydrolase [Flavobacterium sp. 7A]|uniref:family 16 glycosylhydrolase n=1 Tax=Flavobacterium sp. 7A TaxID=2940571 RepID=UPI0022277190|nr:family 16 glycosylhydrolase [Flavobacterium sp. 7A]MCW2119935.1 beta-glucanase (GH16 family) [Flavobacterium sp. 7A]